MDIPSDTPGASPRRHGAPAAMVELYQDPASRKEESQAQPGPQRGQGWQKGGHPSEKETSR